LVPFLVRSRAPRRAMFAMLRTTLFKMHAAAAARGWQSAGGIAQRPAGMRHAPPLCTQKIEEVEA